MHSWHDYNITGYSVDGPNQRVTLNVVWPYESEIEVKSARVVFSGVECRDRGQEHYAKFGGRKAMNLKQN